MRDARLWHPPRPAFGTLQAELDRFRLAGAVRFHAVRLAGLFGWQPAGKPIAPRWHAVELEANRLQLSQPGPRRVPVSRGGRGRRQTELLGRRDSHGCPSWFVRCLQSHLGTRIRDRRLTRGSSWREHNLRVSLWENRQTGLRIVSGRKHDRQTAGHGATARGASARAAARRRGGDPDKGGQSCEHEPKRFLAHETASPERRRRWREGRAEPVASCRRASRSCRFRSNREARVVPFWRLTGGRRGGSVKWADHSTGPVPKKEQLRKLKELHNLHGRLEKIQPANRSECSEVKGTIVSLPSSVLPTRRSS
jgi:hypothetical protein